MPQNPQNAISQTAFNHYYECRSVRTGTLIWVKINTDTGMKLKVEKQSKRDINNYWTSLLLMYLKLNINIVQVSTSSLYL